MHRPRLTSQQLLSIFLSLIVAALILLKLPSSSTAQKTALRLDGTPTDPFLAASGKPVVLVFVRTDCPISNRYAPLIQRISSQYGAKVDFWLGSILRADSLNQRRIAVGDRAVSAHEDEHNRFSRSCQKGICWCAVETQRRFLGGGRRGQLEKDKRCHDKGQEDR